MDNRQLELLLALVFALTFCVVGCSPAVATPTPLTLQISPEPSSRPGHTTLTPTRVSPTATPDLGPPTASPARVPQTATLPPVAGAPSTEKEPLILQQVARQLCSAPSGAFPSPQVTINDTVSSLSCTFAAGHSTSIQIKRYDSPAQVQVAFNSAAAGHSIWDFNGYPVSIWETPFPNAFSSGRQRIWIWQADRWLILIESFDDTGYHVSLNPEQAALAILDLGRQQELFK